jgi:hypothetical protein
MPIHFSADFADFLRRFSQNEGFKTTICENLRKKSAKSAEKSTEFSKAEIADL